MAIAYFIPDQIKLLAASSANNSHTSTNSGGGVGVGNTNPTATATPQPAATAAANSPSGGHPHGTHHHHNSNNNFRANITIPLSAYSATAAQTDTGCWDLLTQIFCHALRFCHQSERHPTVIQISVEISQGDATGATTVQVGAAALPVEQAHQQTASPTLVGHTTAVPQNAATQNVATGNVSAAGVARPTVSSAEAAAPVVSSRNLEPGTHKPAASRR
ncbi:cell death protein Grim [Bactrocera neohumeralis]|uniref:cell death protein Grim n=1 Tax=Bactrocera neohumeralis TaxID=98809 RepID=UPI002165CEDF|nr:cell death protein Grim [Bactrocera neohumeralis]